MTYLDKVTRRDFIKGVALTGAATYVSGLGTDNMAYAADPKSKVFQIIECPVHDNKLRHIGVDTLINLLSDYNIKFYKTGSLHRWGSPTGLIASDDVVLIKVNCQWKCRGTTNTDVARGIIYRILNHPDGFTGEIVIFENGQGQGSFDGDPIAWGSYDSYPTVKDAVIINAEEETLLTVDYLVNTVFAGYPVSSSLLDNIYDHFISDTEHVDDGYRIMTANEISYPCFTTAGSRRIELKDGIWNGSGYDTNLKLINIPVFKTHGGTGITGALKHCYGMLSMADNPTFRTNRHYAQSGTTCGKMYTLVRTPDLNIIDCIWVSQDQLAGYPVSATTRTNILLAGMDPVALDYYASKHILYPLGGSSASTHNPDTYSGLINLLTGAQNFINTHGGIHGEMTNQGDDNIEVITKSAKIVPALGLGSALAGAALLGHQMQKSVVRE
ncbi:MAG: hypothetical protein A2161_14805 [Candidatus Schekmanbacteria bacterium RBG_13_48_7]|uniref:DUF362 domain-containing protein n=1 Tax=Candidatus Schekmanbacteria bacterium RBG_13_48_7 TaxID=1817878 RepID=A0A1F7RVL5_9BACT|nr:MAG: hypothetical protein A2161_14805 [Candidatus Schekmanbacteria bacterium RBG_13_48_7]